jgi:cytochrome c6
MLTRQSLRDIVDSYRKEAHLGWSQARKVLRPAGQEKDTGENMRQQIQYFTLASILCCLAMPGAQAQSDGAKIFKTNCTLCHADDGSGSSPTGKAMKAKDLRSDEVQQQTDAVLTEVITKGRGKMPAFGSKIKPDGVASLVAYIRSIALKK